MIDKPDIVEVISQHVDLRQSGANYKGLCPFHTERTPSFVVSPARQIATCFGCGLKFDVISFTQTYHGISFKDALRELGIKQDGRPVRPDPVQARAREIKKQYQEWKHEYCMHLSKMLCKWDRIREGIKNIQSAESLAGWYHSASVWQLHWEILYSNYEDAKFNLFQEVKNDELENARQAV